VCPTPLKKGLLTKGVVDNIDHNPGSTTAKGSLHGTSISLIQDLSNDSMGIDRPIPLLDEANKNETRISAIPDYYSIVPPAFLRSHDPVIPALKSAIQTTGSQLMQEARDTEYK
jgi:hypothetical protein